MIASSSLPTSDHLSDFCMNKTLLGGKTRRRYIKIFFKNSQSIFRLIFHCNYLDTETITSCEDTLHINSRRLWQWMVMMWSPDRPPWKSGPSIGFGVVQIARVKLFFCIFYQVPVEDLIGSPERRLRVHRRSLLTFLRRPWNPLSRNSITIRLRGGDGPQDSFLLFYWHTRPSAPGRTITEPHFFF